MPYIRKQHFTQIKTLLETIEELVSKNNEASTITIKDIVARVLKVMNKYIVDDEEEEE